MQVQSMELLCFHGQKSNGTHRFVVDARALNSQVIRDQYELTKVSRSLDSITESRYWSSFDLTSSFTQIGLAEESRPLTAFTYNKKRYQFNRLLQGQTNS